MAIPRGPVLSLSLTTPEMPRRRAPESSVRAATSIIARADIDTQVWHSRYHRACGSTMASSGPSEVLGSEMRISAEADQSSWQRWKRRLP